MTYSIIGIIATIILLIINRDVLWVRKDQTVSETNRNYRLFLLGVLGYYITDLLWGILESQRLSTLLFIDTTIHFTAMVWAVMMWTQYVVSYLNRKSVYEKILSFVGKAFFCFEAIVVIVNTFYPVLFWLDDSGAYHAGIVRYITLGIQILLFTETSLYAFCVALKTEDRIRLRHLTIAMFGLSMTLLIAIQVFYPLLPFYAIGYMIGTCLLHSFVVEDEKEEYRRELEQAAIRDRQQKEELYESRESLKDALADAEKANKAKTAFLSNMSHEIRTPMNAIIGLDNIALDDPEVSEHTREYLDKIDIAAHHLLNIINDILDMSRIESGRMTIKHEEFSFSKMLEHVNTIISGQCHDKGLNYECRTKGEIDEYYDGDSMKLMQVMINILGNSVKFTPEGGRVSVFIEEISRMDNKSTLRFTFKDTGIGMSEDYVPHIFDAFSQEDSSSTNKYGSTGLGMPITKSIVELMNGSIEVQSEKGVGTTFTFTVTLGQVKNRQRIDDDIELRPGDMNVLVIDDDSVDCEHAEVILKKVGIRCDTVTSGSEAIELIKTHHTRREDYDLLLVDWKMPEMDGVETTRRIRDIVGNDTPIIILTSYSWEDIEEEARNAGVDTFAAKPLFAGTVMEEFKAAFRKKNTGPASGSVDLRGKRILLAEDMPINAQIMIVMLESREMEVDHAENGRIALEMYLSHEEGYYDAVLMDMRMPEMDGLQATREIRASARADSKNIPIIALTANAFDEDVQRSMQAGLNAHLSKPVEPDVLFKTMEDLLCERRKR